MSNKQHSPADAPTTSKSFVSKDTGSSRKRLAIISIVLLLVAGSGLAYYFSSAYKNTEPKTDKPKAQSEFPAPRHVEYSETITPTAFGNFLAVALEVFWSGGNANGTDIPGHNYYPSNADVSDETWVKANLKVHDGIIKSLKDGTLVYHPNGCKADRPSSMQNKCTSFTIQSEGKEVARSKN